MWVVPGHRGVTSPGSSLTHVHEALILCNAFGDNREQIATVARNRLFFFFSGSTRVKVETPRSCRST